MEIQVHERRGLTRTSTLCCAVLSVVATLSAAACNGTTWLQGDDPWLSPWAVDVPSVSISSPTQYELGVRAAPWFGVGDNGATVHPVIGYSRSILGGVEGETDNKLFLGGQARSAPTSAGSGLWFGGEASYVRRWTSFDSPGIDSETTNGWTVAALAGLPIAQSPIGVYVAAGVNKYGGAGFYGRLGFELTR